MYFENIFSGLQRPNSTVLKFQKWLLTYLAYEYVSPDYFNYGLCISQISSVPMDVLNWKHQTNIWERHSGEFRINRGSITRDEQFTGVVRDQSK